jgi:hypothetical protein
MPDRIQLNLYYFGLIFGHQPIHLLKHIFTPVNHLEHCISLFPATFFPSYWNRELTSFAGKAMNFVLCS